MIVFSAGGTGGHLFPALAIAEQIRDLAPGAPIAFIGTPDHLEATVVPREGYPFYPIAVRGLPRRPGPALVSFALGTLLAVARAKALLRRLAPKVVVGCGAYVSVPAILAARTLGIPTLIAESNAYPGIANRFLGNFADRVVVAIPGTEQAFPAGKAICLGNPIRAAFGNLTRDSARRDLGFPSTPRLLVVTGGSLGAKALNEAFLPLVSRVLEQPEWSILHIAGGRNLAEVAALAGAQGEAEGVFVAHDGRYRLIAFCDRMPLAIVAADLLVARSGATTVSELAAAGRPAVFVPLAINPDQLANARFLEGHGAALVVPNERVAADLGPALLPLLDDIPRISAMGDAARAKGRPDAARGVALEVLALAGSKAHLADDAGQWPPSGRP